MTRDESHVPDLNDRRPTVGPDADAARRAALRMAVDVSIFTRPRAGIARYQLNMLMSMLSLFPELELLLYSPSPVDLGLPSGNWRLRADTWFSGRLASIWVQRQVPLWLAEDRPDAFWGQNHMLPLKLRRPCYRVLTVHDLAGLLVPETMPLASRLISKMFLGRAIRAADGIMADSMSTAEQVRRCVGVDNGRLHVVYPGFDKSLFFPGDVSRSRLAIAESYAIERDYVIMVGTIEPRKGHMTALAALRLLDRPPLLVVVGAPGWRCGHIVRELGDAARAGRVRVLGSVDDVQLAQLYRAAKLALCPSHYEGFGLPVLEAMACGCPVLCSRTSSLPEVAGHAGEYFRRGDAGELAAKMASLLASPDLLRDMSARGMTRSRAFGYDSAARRFVQAVLGGLQAGTVRGHR